MNKKVYKRWVKLFEIYFDNSFASEEWRARVDRLLAAELFEEEKYAALEPHFYRIIDEYESNI